MDTKNIDESANPGTVVPLTGRKIKIRLIEGDKLGSSGYYPAEVLKRDGPKIFKAGTPMFLDHQTPEERAAKPFGSIKDYAAVLAEDAYYENDGLYAEAEVFENEASRIRSLKDLIGVSIRAVGKSVNETINDKIVPVFKELTEARSVDFVMRAGAGGKIVQILESATEENPVEEAETEEGKENMEEVLKAIESLKADFDTRLTALEEGLKPEPVVEAVKEDKPEVDVLETAKLLSNSTLSEEGRARVLQLSLNSDKSLAELIEAEEAYIKVAQEAQLTGVEEGDEVIEESALAEPKAWSKK